MQYYQDQNGDFITVAEGSIKRTYAFFRIDKNKPGHRGSRVKTRPMLFFPTMEEGFAALEDYAKKRQWEFVGTKLPAAKIHQTSPKRGTGAPLLTWLVNYQHRPTEKPKPISNAEYELFKTELVRQAIIVIQNDMKDWKKPDPLRAIQWSIAIMSQSHRWSSELFDGLHKRLLHDNGERVNSKYQIKNLYGGVFVRVEAFLLESKTI